MNKSVKSISALEERIAQLEQLLESNAKPELLMRHDEMARFLALFSIVQELADTAGISEAEFQLQFDARREFFKDRILARTSDLDPGTAAALDDRDIADVPTEGFPPLFADEDDEG